MKPAAIRAKLLELAAERGPEKTFCPSEVARSLASDWRPLMESVRKEAAQLVKKGGLICTQKGSLADPLLTHGAIRLSQRLDK